MTARIVLAGSLNIDIRIQLPKIPAPGETVLTSAQEHRDLGGKGTNQAIAASRLGAEVTLIAAVGDDSHGQWAREQLAKERRLETLIETRSLPTGKALILIADDGENSIVVQSVAHKEIGFLPHFEATIREADILLLQLEIEPDVAAAFAEAAKSAACASSPTLPRSLGHGVLAWNACSLPRTCSSSTTLRPGNCPNCGVITMTEPRVYLPSGPHPS